MLPCTVWCVDAYIERERSTSIDQEHDVRRVHIINITIASMHVASISMCMAASPQHRNGRFWPFWDASGTFLCVTMVKHVEYP